MRLLDMRERALSRGAGTSSVLQGRDSGEELGRHENRPGFPSSPHLGAGAALNQRLAKCSFFEVQHNTSEENFLLQLEKRASGVGDASARA